MGERVMEGGHWNPAIVGGAATGSEVWPLPVECLMNGMIPTTATDAHLTLFGNSLILPSQFRHRFQHTVHFPTPGSLGHHHGGPSSLNLSIPPQHSMVESSDPSSLGRTSSDPQTTGQETHSQPLALRNGHHVLDECSDDCSDDEDDEEASDEDMDDQEFVHHHDQQQQQVSISAMGHPSLTVVEEDSLPSCQHNQQQTNVINGDALQQATLMGGMDESCHQKNSMLTNGISHGPCHEDEIPTINHGHPLNSNPISAIPMITGNSLLMSDNAEDEFSENPPPPSEHHHDNIMDGDPRTGQSVHGKMYVEGRVVFHLKQWSDSVFGSFNSCREQEQQKSQLQGCAVCRLRSPNGHDYRGQQKDAHRHPVRGVLLTFGDCIVAELYPEHQLTGINSVGPQPLDPKQHEMEILKSGHPMPITSYLGSAVETQNDAQMSNMATSSLHLQKSSATQQSTQEQSWWDDFDSERAETEGDSSPDPTADMHHPPSCIMNMKLQQEPLENSYHPQQQELPEKQINSSNVIEDNMNEYQLKWKCDRCSLGFLTNEQFESHQCMTALNVSDAQSVISLETDFKPQDVEVIHEEALITESRETESEKDIPEINTEIDGLTEHPESTIEECPHEEIQKHGQNKNGSKYLCPTCSKPFIFKKLLKQHLEEEHGSGNAFRCEQCNIQYADGKRLKRHSCTLSVEQIKTRSHKSQKNHSVEILINLPNEELDDENSSEPTHIDEPSRLKEDGEIRTFTKGNNQKTEKESNETEENISNSSKKVEENFKVLGKLKKKKLKSVKFRRLKLESVPVTPTLPSTLTTNSFPQEEEEEVKDDDESKEIDEDEEGDYETQTRFLTTNSNEIKTQQVQTRNGSSKKGFRCNVCGKLFTVERRLINHKASHKMDRSSQCDKCGKRFARKDKLMRHMYVHSEEKMFVCEICEKRFSRRDKLSDHLKSHQTDEIHNCPMCEKQFLRPDILKQHVKLHRMGNKHQCPECLRFVTGQDRLTKHMKRHEESKALGQTLLCPLCTKYFIQRQSLKAHIKKFHPDALNQLESDGGKSCAELNPDSPSSSNMSLGGGDVREESEIPSSKRSNVTTVCLLLEDVMGISKVVSSKSKPFSCQQCTQTFVRKQALKKHMQVKHSESCSRSSSNSSNNNTLITRKSKIISNQNELIENDSEEAQGEIDEGLLPIHGQCKEESNPSSLSSLSTSPSPPTVLMSMANILHHQQQQQQEQLNNNNNSNSDNIGLSHQELPSCSSLQEGRDLSNQSHTTVVHPQQAHLNAYSHHLALASMASMAVVGSNNNSSVNLTSSLMQHSLDSAVHGQQLSSIHSAVGLSMGHHSHMTLGGGGGGGGQSASVMCPSSSYVLNYPPYHYQ